MSNVAPVISPTAPAGGTSVNITINGRAMVARAGQTVMEAAADAGIDIPSLCHSPVLKPEGACRVCLVEIEKQRTLQPACTFPVAEGMVVQTETPKVVEARKFSLQMLFSERSHYCMFCAMSGGNDSTDCELQKLAYRYGMNCWEYAPDYAKPWPLDASRRYFVMDHSRCILCRRCIRACNTIAANHTLGVTHRGARTMVCADDDVPFGESTCVSCGTCLQVCPTGALTDRRSAFMGHETETVRTKATCMGCAVGCGIEAITRDNQLLRIEGDWTAPNGGLLCAVGRFEVTEPKPPRILWPLVRNDGELIETSWDGALGIVAQRLKESASVCGLISPRMTNRLLAGFACFFNEVLRSTEFGLLYGDVPPLDLGPVATLADVASSDCVIVIGGDPLKEQKVVGALVKRACDQGAAVVVVNDRPTDLDPYAQLKLQLEDISHANVSPFERMRFVYHLRVNGLARLKSAIEKADWPVVLYGAGLSATLCAALRALPDRVKFLPLVRGTNAVGAQKLGLEVKAVRGDVLYVIAGDDMPDGYALPGASFKIVQAAYRSTWTDAADVVLPSRTWCEKPGEIVTLEGRKLPSMPLIEPPKSVQADLETLLMLSVRMGNALPYDQISDICVAV